MKQAKFFSDEIVGVMLSITSETPATALTVAESVESLVRDAQIDAIRSAIKILNTSDAPVNDLHQLLDGIKRV